MNPTKEPLGLSYDQLKEIAQELNLPSAGVVQGVINAASRIAERDGVKVDASDKITRTGNVLSCTTCGHSAKMADPYAVGVAEAGESIDTPEFRKIVSEVQGWSDGHAVMEHGRQGAGTQKLIAYINAQLARQRQGEVSK